MYDRILVQKNNILSPSINANFGSVIASATETYPRLGINHGDILIRCRNIMNFSRLVAVIYNYLIGFGT